MLNDSPYVAKRVEHDIPIWAILVRGVDVGTLTDLPMEACPMATVRYAGKERTFVGDTVYFVLDQVGSWLELCDAEEQAIIEEHAAEYFAEVIGPMQAAERQAEEAFWRMHGNEPWEAF